MFNLNSDFLAEILGDECCAIYIQLKMQFGVTHHYPVWFHNDHINIIIHNTWNFKIEKRHQDSNENVQHKIFGNLSMIPERKCHV